MKRAILIAGAIVLLGSCMTVPTWNPENAPEDQLVEVMLEQVKPADVSSNWAIIAIDGIPVADILDSELVEANEKSDDSNGFLLPVGTHSFAIKLANGQLFNRSLYLNHELTIEFNFDKPGATYQLERQSTLMGGTRIVQREVGFLPFLAPRIDQVDFELAGMNEWQVQEQ